MLAKLLTNCAADALLTDCAGSKLLRTCPKMKIVFTWTGAGPPTYQGWDLFSEITFLGVSRGWYLDGFGPTAYLTWSVSESTGVGGYEQYTVDLEKSHDDGGWGASTTIPLKADWFFSRGTALTVSVTYNGVTQSKVISPSALRVIPTPLAPTDPIVTSVGLVTVDDNGAFTLL